MTYLEYTFSFGKKVKPQNPGIIGQRDFFILGAYPSALHVKWLPPNPYKQIRAIAVNNEPSIFWDGTDQNIIHESWLRSIPWQNNWGEIEPAGRFNGSSGVWVNEKVLSPLGFQRNDVWFLDCFDIYHCSKGLSKRLDDTYLPFAEKNKIENSNLPVHPDENRIIKESIEHHRERIESSILLAQPKVIITLGNAALRVMTNLIRPDKKVPGKLSPSSELYGTTYKVIGPGEIQITLLPLAHPAAPKIYQQAHDSWIEAGALKKTSLS